MKSFEEIKKLYQSTLIRKNIAAENCSNIKKIYYEKYPISLIGVFSRLQHPQLYGEMKREVKAFEQVYNQLNFLSESLGNIEQIIDRIFQKIYEHGNKKIGKNIYEKFTKIYQQINKDLEVVLRNPTGMNADLTRARLEEKWIELLYLNKKVINDSASNEYFKDENSALYSLALYESVKDYKNINELLENSLVKGYSYDTYSMLVSTFFIYQNSREKYLVKEDQVLQNNDLYVISRHTCDPEILDLYSKKQLISTSKMLIEEYEKRKKSESYEVLDSLSQIVKYLKRYR